MPHDISEHCPLQAPGPGSEDKWVRRPVPGLQGSQPHGGRHVQLRKITIIAAFGMLSMRQHSYIEHVYSSCPPETYRLQVWVGKLRLRAVRPPSQQVVEPVKCVAPGHPAPAPPPTTMLWASGGLLSSRTPDLCGRLSAQLPSSGSGQCGPCPVQVTRAS